MPDHFCVTRQTADQFLKLFVNRLAYGIQRDKPLSDGTFPYIKQKRPLDLDAVRMHLNGDITINLYAINPQTQSSKWVAIDADYEGSLAALFQLQWELRQDGVDAALEQSRRGGHLWVLAENHCSHRNAVSISTISPFVSECLSKVQVFGKGSRSSQDRTRLKQALTVMRFADHWECTARATGVTGSTKRT